MENYKQFTLFASPPPLNEFLSFVYLKWSQIRSFFNLIYLAVLGLSCGIWDRVP